MKKKIDTRYKELAEKQSKCSLYWGMVNICFSLLVLIVKKLISLTRDQEDKMYQYVSIVFMFVKLFYCSIQD